jgi:predicted DNA-binding protein
MSKTDPESRELLTDTMKKLFPPRVELDREQHERLRKLCEKTGKTVTELVEQALERYLQDEGQGDAADGAAP